MKRGVSSKHILERMHSMNTSLSRGQPSLPPRNGFFSQQQSMEKTFPVITRSSFVLILKLVKNIAVVIRTGVLFSCSYCGETQGCMMLSPYRELSGNGL